MSRKRGSNGKNDYRQTLIAQILIERPSATQRQIQKALGEQMLNPETGKPHSLGTINNDIKAVRKGWQAKAERDYGEWVTDELAKLDRIEGKAWTNADYGLILKCMNRRAALLGLDKPAKHEHSGPDGGAIAFADVSPRDTLTRRLDSIAEREQQKRDSERLDGQPDNEPAV